MPTFDSYEPGWPCWVDLSSPDVDAAKTFYGSVFGWTGEDMFDPEGNRIYTNLSLDGQLVCGLGGQQPGMEGMPPVWSTYICTDDAEASAAKVAEAGGTVMMPPMQVMDAGSMAVFADPTGAVVSVWQPKDHTGAQVANEPNTWSWNELTTRDLEAAQPFYSAVFGWEYETQDSPMGPYHVIKGGKHEGLGGMMSMPPGMPEQVPNHWMVYFYTADMDATVAAIADGGGQLVNGPDEAPGVGRIAVAHDPQGGSFALLQPESS